MIDFHVHAFADKIAEKAIKGLAEAADTPNITNGTFDDTVRLFKSEGVDNGVFLPIATKPTQQTVINDWAKFVIEKGYYSYGSVHPEAADVLDELDRIKELGLFGIKLHAEYQNFFAFEERMFPIYEKCSELNLPIIFHCGWDPICKSFSETTLPKGFSEIITEKLADSPETVRRCSPKMLAFVAEKFPKLTVIAAHLGGAKDVDETLKYLAGKKGNIYLDTAIVPYYMSTETAEKIIRQHGVDRVLFASDCPWYNPRKVADFLEKIFNDNELEKIYTQNALRILK